MLRMLRARLQVALASSRRPPHGRSAPKSRPKRIVQDVRRKLSALLQAMRLSRTRNELLVMVQSEV